MWHGPNDHVVWRVTLDRPAAFDVYLDYACHDDSAGNRFVLEGGDPPVRGKVAGTGGWDRYRTEKVGTLKLPAGPQALTFRPDGDALRGALIDLRTIHLVPPGEKPAAPAEPRADPTAVAKQLLDDGLPAKDRQALVARHPDLAAELLAAMTADLKPGTKEEYRRIPWVWRVAVAAGRRNRDAELKAILDLALPAKGGALYDWQAVVIGGGVVNGISLEGQWPGRRVGELLKGDPGLAGRWREALAAAAKMADDEKVPAGTRYDALRMVALDSWDRGGSRLAKYLAKDANPELQMGAVSGLSDAEAEQATGLLLGAVADLTPANRKLALDALLRTEARARALLDAMEKGAVKIDLTDEQKKALHERAKKEAR